MKELVSWFIELYQKTISMFTPSTCRFYPSCSQYAKGCIDRYGIWTGSWLALRRLLRCHPLSPGGLDPVPSTIKSRRKGQ